MSGVMGQSASGTSCINIHGIPICGCTLGYGYLCWYLCCLWG